jgi:hypothetical protein
LPRIRTFYFKTQQKFFSELKGSDDNLLEREANIFSAVILMPDIVLLSKIYYNCETFEKVKNSLKVSKQALRFRLLDLLREFSPNKDSDVTFSVESYIDGNNAPIILRFNDIKEIIIEEFNKYKPSLSKKVKKSIKRAGFVTSTEIPELLNQKEWDQLKKDNPNLKIWLVYNKGKSLAYVWDKNKISENEAKKKAELQLLLMNV